MGWVAWVPDWVLMFAGLTVFLGAVWGALKGLSDLPSRFGYALQWAWSRTTPWGREMTAVQATARADIESLCARVDVLESGQAKVQREVQHLLEALGEEPHSDGDHEDTVVSMTDAQLAQALVQVLRSNGGAGGTDT